MSDEESPVLVAAMCELGAPVETVFALISDHAALPKWVPGLRRVDVDQSRASAPGGIGTRRTLRPFIGTPGVEVVTDFEPPHRLVYSATDESLRGLLVRHSTELSCSPTAGGTRFRWIVRGQPSGSCWKRVMARLLFGIAQRASMRKLVKLFPMQPPRDGEAAQRLGGTEKR